MNIDSVNSPTTSPFTSGIQRKGETHKAGPAGEIPADTLALSRRQDLLRKLAALPEIRPEAVIRGKQYLENRETDYSVALDAVAQKLAAGLPESFQRDF